MPKDVAPETPVSFEVDISPVNGGTAIDNTGQLHYSINGASVVTTSMTRLSAHKYQADLPALDCGDEIEFYVSAEEVLRGRVYDPDPVLAHRAIPMTDSLLVFDDNFEADYGWTVSGDAEAGIWERGVPANGDRGDPPADADGSGQCYLTGNEAGDSDVDWGSTQLNSPTIDVSGGDGLVSYWRWYSNDYGHDPNNDLFITFVSNDNGATWAAVETVGPIKDCSGGWNQFTFWVGDFVTPTDQVKIRFEVGDLPDHSVIEAAIDGVVVKRCGCRADFDDDGYLNTEDNCPLTYNPDQDDADGDGLGDSCDFCPHDELNDADGDGVCGDIDNCKGTPNANQLDSDADSVGNLCDNCPNTYNPGQVDADSNGVGDDCESCCTGESVGNVDGSPDGQVTMADLTVMIDHLFISLAPLTCVEEGDTDQSGGSNPAASDVTMADLTLLIDYLFISLNPLPPCL